MRLIFIAAIAVGIYFAWRYMMSQNAQRSSNKRDNSWEKDKTIADQQMEIRRLREELDFERRKNRGIRS